MATISICRFPFYRPQLLAANIRFGRALLRIACGSSRYFLRLSIRAHSVSLLKRFRGCWVSVILFEKCFRKVELRFTQDVKSDRILTSGEQELQSSHC